MLFWSDTAHGTVNRMLAGGGDAAALATNQNGPTLLALFGQTLYWIDGGSQSLMKVPATGGTPAVVATSPNAGDSADKDPGINGFTVGDDGTVYFSSETHVYAVAPTGGAPVDVVDEARGGLPWGLAISGTTLAYTINVNGDIDAVTLTPGQVASCGALPDAGAGVPSCQIAISYGPVMDSIFIQNGQVYWADNVDGQGEFAAIAPPSRSRSSFGGFNVGTIAAFTVAGDTAFMVAESEVVAAPLVDESVAEPLARLVTSSGATSIAADDARVYWSTLETATPGASMGTCFVDSVAH